MVIKLRGNFILDVTDIDGRHIEVQWDTDRRNVNDALQTPLVFKKLYRSGDDNTLVIDDFKALVVPIVESMLSRLKNKLKGVTVEEDITEI